MSDSQVTIQIQGDVTDFNAGLAELRENIVRLKNELKISSGDIKQFWQTAMGGVAPAMKDVVNACKNLSSELEKAARKVSAQSATASSTKVLSAQSTQQTSQKTDTTAAATTSAAKQSGSAGASKSLTDFAKEGKDIGTQLDNVFGKAFSNMTDALVEFTMTGKANFKDLADSIIKDLLRMTYQAAISPFMSSLSGWIKGLFSSGVSGAADTSGSTPNLSFDNLFGLKGSLTEGFDMINTVVPKEHTGGVIGVDSPTYRLVPGFDFSGAQRYHAGLKGDEFPAILQNGESVFTKGQTQALGGLLKGGDSGIATVNMHNITINAADAKSFSDLCKRNPEAITGPIMRGLQDNRTRKRMKELIGR